MLNIIKSLEGDAMTITLEGRLDSLTSANLEKEVKDLPESVKELTMDLEKLEYISSAGLRVLLLLQKTMAKRGGMKLIHVSEMVMEIFEVTAFTDILTIE